MNKSIEIYEWEEIKCYFSGFILLGNGASISIDERFRYKSLFDEACKENFLSDESVELFEKFKTCDFEYILRMLWHAQLVNKSLKIQENKTIRHYNEIKLALIKIVRKIHPSYKEIMPFFKNAGNFLKRFDVVFSLNYDLIVYWLMLYNNNCDRSHAFKDCFKDHIDTCSFTDNWRKYRVPINQQRKSTLVFYPHGNLILAQKNDAEYKLKNSIDENLLLERILAKWMSDGYIPQFISEGTSQQKINAINRSHYLNTVYYDIFQTCHDNLTIYGCSFSENDNHLFSVLKSKKFNIDKIAVSVYGEDNEIQQYCKHVTSVIHQLSNRQDIKIYFFKSNSANCWIN
ncbi:MULTISPECIES: DUF4917 family protein [Pectobacterium]|uniref:DUF4917 family protein n=1 Tax=Pectobacterium TaxID=122277 RepID=UPI00027E0D51|nr:MULTISPECIES: DUF4917 family protein [Pectobacterium]AFR03977.1 hypothetical protein PCC21_025740 [Pectobacterium carotovorum subsp. carotovorum PCC21]UPY96737.1 DUF4917 family protein [Pectobacterium sp. 21LCBS03]GKV98996.1 DUF4917 domain-containing protein [Pectobacterium carotovorum subsp. carotovorum]